jgi:hypothetical protein
MRSKAFLHDRDIKNMSKIVTRQKDLNSDHRRLGTNCVLRYFLLIYIMIPYVPHIKPYYACLACFFNVFTNSDIYRYV